MPRRNMDGAVGGTDNKSFCSKPSRGWSHADNVITNEGVTFSVQVRENSCGDHTRTLHFHHHRTPIPNFSILDAWR